MARWAASVLRIVLMVDRFVSYWVDRPMSRESLSPCHQKNQPLCTCWLDRVERFSERRRGGGVAVPLP